MDPCGPILYVGAVAPLKPDRLAPRLISLYSMGERIFKHCHATMGTSALPNNRANDAGAAGGVQTQTDAGDILDESLDLDLSDYAR
jgi:hypothetical protein